MNLFRTQPTNLRNNIVNGLILLFNPAVTVNGRLDSMVLTDDIMVIATELNISGDFAYRSFGRTLLYRLIRLAKQKHSTLKEIELTE